MGMHSESGKRVGLLNETRIEQLKSQCCSDCLVYHAKKQDQKITMVNPPLQKCSGNSCRSPDKNFSQTLDFSYAENLQMEELWEEVSEIDQIHHGRSHDAAEAEVFIEQLEGFSHPSEVVALNLILLNHPKISEKLVKNGARITGKFSGRTYVENRALELISQSLESKLSSYTNFPLSHSVQRLSRKKQLPNRLRQDEFLSEQYSKVNQTKFSRILDPQTSSKLTWEPLTGLHDVSPIRKIERRENKDRNLYRSSQLFLSLPGLKNGYKEMEIRKKIYKQLNESGTPQNNKFDWSNQVNPSSQFSSTNNSQGSASSISEVDLNFGQCPNCSGSSSETSKQSCQRKWCFSTKVNYPVVCDPLRLIISD